MVGGSFDKLSDEKYLRRATLNIIEETKMTLAGIESYKRGTQIQTMSKSFHTTRVYDTAIPSYRGNWSFAVGIVPKLDGEEDEDEFEQAV
jgi:hypothetical protein